MGDRTGWLRDKVTRSLGVSESNFSELLERQGPDGKTYWESLNAFLDHEDTVESVVMFYTTEEVIGGTDGTPFERRARLRPAAETPPPRAAHPAARQRLATPACCMQQARRLTARGVVRAQ
jgi:hypothetical protein